MFSLGYLPIGVLRRVTVAIVYSDFSFRGVWVSLPMISSILTTLAFFIYSSLFIPLRGERHLFFYSYLLSPWVCCAFR